ncbi:actin-like ATPase domain-containing protein [Rhizophagus irregularis]|uniref:Actin-like ATPase domain-containing protein n=1 Tax=Rhizophagus irregularis TaxID=588596 RepID=A0A2N0S810_9GLOM|nr:actin-like ATPase domain-containing protein [Rhizophagus irregularis]PKK77670.1 actin-like ATPase domain-containing protein [Rhizophagus irregularis]CAB4375358.1 unnamed protein product [Rhizophagus irregularis]CAB5127320.1 unnamed protein product [Rhizophagus irregularis]
MSSSSNDIRVVVAIDFGTTFSGYAYAHKSNPKEITVESKWGGTLDFKTPTIIKYEDESYSTINSWGFDAFPEKPSRRRKNVDKSRPVELFKLFLLNEKPPFPDTLDYRKAISDYLRKLGEMIKEKVDVHWHGLDFYNKVLIVLMIPAGYDDHAIAIMRGCAFNAGLTREKNSRNLIFITEPEAAAISCLNPLEKLHNLKPGDSFMIVDCGGGTVDLSCHELLANNKIREITRPTGGSYGSSFVDKEFVGFLRRKLGSSTIELLEKEHYNVLQYIVQKFCRRVKIPFTGERTNFQPYEIDLDDYSLLKDIIKGEKEKRLLEEADWSIFVEYDDIKGMFDHCITKIIHLIREQLAQLQNKRCSAIMLVGGFSESEYLQARIQKEFNKIVLNISVPSQPIIAVVKGGVQYGLRAETMENRGKTSDIRVIVGLDFGTTYSGFTCCHISDSKIYLHTKWPPREVYPKINTILQYDRNFVNIVDVGQWGYPEQDEKRPVELFKLHLGTLQENLKPRLPVAYKKAITDYLYKLGKLIKETVKKNWVGINFTENVLLVLTVPAEYSEKEKAIMRECAHNAGLISEGDSLLLQFTTEPEAAAIYCMDKLREYDLTIGTTFMIVDCGGGTVDLTTRKLTDNKRLGEITERIGDFCGSTFIDNEFGNFLRERLGTRAVNLLIENRYNQFQRLVRKFCRRVKLPFTGNNTRFSYELEIDECAPDLLEYVSNETRKTMEDKDWVIDIKYDDIKKMFDPIIERIIRMIHVQLLNTRNNGETCSAIFLVGGFSENIYLQKRIKQEFQHIVKNISVPTNPVSAVVQGAAMYGLSLKNPSKVDAPMIHTRVLKFTYGIRVLGIWKEGEHPPHRKIYGNRIYLFDTFVKRGTQVEVGKESSPKRGYTPLNPSQTGLRFELFKTLEYSAKYHDEPGMELVGTLRIDLPGIDLARKRPVAFGFYFGDMEITAFAKNELSGQNFQTKFYLHKDL